MILPASADQVIVSVNPKAGRTSPMIRAEQLVEELRKKNFSAELLTDLDQVASRARQLQSEKRLRALIGVGGDGTAATLVNLTEPGTPITLLAAGTANLLSKHFRLGSNPKRLAETVAGGHVVTLDAGRAKSQQSDRLFLVMVGCGFDADIVKQVHAHREERYREGHKKGAHISYFSYVKPICKSLWSYRFPKMKVESINQNGEVTDSTVIDDKIRWAFFFNMNRYGWGLPLAPFAKENDGKLDHSLFQGRTVFHGFVYTAFAQVFGMHRILPDVRLGRATKYRITSDEPIPYQLDGDPGGELPLEIEVIPNRLTLLVPERSAKRFT